MKISLFLHGPIQGVQAETLVATTITW